MASSTATTARASVSNLLALKPTLSQATVLIVMRRSAGMRAGDLWVHYAAHDVW